MPFPMREVQKNRGKDVTQTRENIFTAVLGSTFLRTPEGALENGQRLW